MAINFRFRIATHLLKFFLSGSWSLYHSDSHWYIYIYIQTGLHQAWRAFSRLKKKKSCVLFVCQHDTVYVQAYILVLSIVGSIANPVFKRLNNSIFHLATAANHFFFLFTSQPLSFFEIELKVTKFKFRQGLLYLLVFLLLIILNVQS